MSSHNNVTSIVTMTDFKAFLSTNSKVVVDFTASWCGPCQRIAPKIEAMAAENKGSVAFCSVDVDESSSIPDIYDISSMPTFLFFIDGELLNSFTVIGAKETEIRKSVTSLKNA